MTEGKTLSSVAIVVLIGVAVIGDIGFSWIIWSWHIVPAMIRGYWLIVPPVIFGYAVFMLVWNLCWYYLLSKRTRRTIKKKVKEMW